MYREISQKLIEWKNSQRRKPLMLLGVRQSGKTYELKKLGREQFENTCYINFEASCMYSAIFDFDNQTTHTDQYTFDKKTYEVGRDYSPKAQRARYASTLKSNKYKTGGSKATYRVRKGDTLGKIASRHGVSVKKLCRLNGIKTTTKLKIGKTLRVR